MRVRQEIQKIATEIFASLPGMSKDLINLHERTDFPEAKIYFVGFCVHRGTCSLEIGNFLSGLSYKSVALFGTCGAGNSLEYYKRSHPVSGSGLKTTIVILVLLSARKMPLAVRQKYESLLNTPEDCDCQQIRRQLQNFDEAMIHPTRTDLEKCGPFATECIEKVKSM